MDLNINGKTIINAVIGNPIMHTMSPMMHNMLYKKEGLNYVYIPMLLEEPHLKSFFELVKTKSFKGINVTVPFKEKVIPFLDDIDKKASMIGAVNTIVNSEGRLKGYNTDGDGFIYSVKEETNYNVSNKTVAMLGAGGSAKAIAFSLMEQRVEKLIILNRTLQKATHLKSNLMKFFNIPIQVTTLNDFDSLESSDLIINTTSIGMTPYEDLAPISQFDWIKSTHYVYDIIYNPSLTVLLKEANRRKATIQNGKGMLAAQGMLAHRLFTNNPGSYKIMKSQIN